ncbi:MAG: benzoyl-CoA-dihydrodiol lyase [Acidimicrobiales bacterium]|jgi:benzoyl-CoA-dihydrodiol lyase
MSGKLDFERTPDRYQHWKLVVAPPLATLTMAVEPSGGALGDYELKLNSYDIGVDIELADAIRRLRFEHPEVRCVVLDSAIVGTFCAGANIRMLAAANHSHKVNFCKFTNETRLEMEDASAHSGLRFLAAVQGACSGGGYELALACDHIVLVDDRASAVSLPEVPLLGVLPGTGGLTRVTDKRHVRRDLADVFATRAEGVQGAEAQQWGLVDELAPPSGFAEVVEARAHALAATSKRSADDEAVVLEPLERSGDHDSIRYRYVSAEIDRSTRSVAITIEASSAVGWPLAAARELDDVLCHLRFNEASIGTLILGTRGTHADASAHDRALSEPANHAERETSLLWRRVLSRLDLTARSLFAVVDPGSCFSGILAELALAADRSFMLDGIFEDDASPLPPAALSLGPCSLGVMPMANDLSRLRSRFWGQDDAFDRAEASVGRFLVAAEANELELVTTTPDDLDWEDELRLAIEERASFSPDALTGMEANHRFCGPETMATKIFSRLSAWQNWIFIRPNAGGPDGALRRYGTGSRPQYDPDRT